MDHLLKNISIEPALKTQGRRKKTEIDKLRAIVWFNALAITSQLGTPYKITKALTKNLPADSAFFRRLFKNMLNWRDGKSSPTEVWLQKIEMVSHGSSRWFNHPIWTILEKSHTVLTAQHVKDLVIQLPFAHSILFDRTLHPVLGCTEKRIRVARPVDADRIRCFSYVNSDVDYSEHHPTCLDNLATILILTHEAKILEVKESRESQILALEVLHESIPIILKMPVLEGIATQFVDYINSTSICQYPGEEEKSIGEEFRRATFLALGLDTDPPYHWTNEVIGLLGTMSDKKLAKKLGILVTMVSCMRQFYEKPEFISIKKVKGKKKAC